VGARFSAPVPTGPGGHPSSCTMGTGSSPWVQTGRGETLIPHLLLVAWTVRGSNPGGDEILRTCTDRPWGPPTPLYNGYRIFPGGTNRPGRDADPSPPSSAVVKKGYSYTSTPPMGRTACTEPQCLYKGALYLYLLF